MKKSLNNSSKNSNNTIKVRLFMKRSNNLNNNSKNSNHSLSMRTFKHLNRINSLMYKCQPSTQMHYMKISNLQKLKAITKYSTMLKATSNNINPKKFQDLSTNIRSKNLTK